MTETVEMKTASATPSETKLMKAIVRTRFGPPKVLQLKEIEKPVPIAAITALQALRDHGRIQPGQKVLVNGAGGGVGTYAVQIAKSFGTEVTAVTSTENLEMVRLLGADHVIDYNKQDYTRNGERYDLICDIAASQGFSDYKRSLTPGGTFVLVGMKDKIILRLLYFSLLRRLLSGGRKFRFFIAKINQKDLNLLSDLLETRKIKSVIDRSYRIDQVVEAMQYLGEGHARGKIVVTVGSDMNDTSVRGRLQ